MFKKQYFKYYFLFLTMSIDNVMLFSGTIANKGITKVIIKGTLNKYII
jgi:hypothetical protein